ncbi:MAG: hypothetical protein Q7W30_05835 [Coriobacteriia bacterium]|jgi:hypothetical protein|nr:hypothetical protein [Coriobacteriia bacterium]
MRIALISILIAACLALAGCGIVDVNVNGAAIDTSSPAAAIDAAKKEAAAAACSAIRAQLDRQYILARSETLNSEVSVTFGSVLQKVGKPCPSKGVYTYDEAAKTTSCSVHSAGN